MPHRLLPSLLLSFLLLLPSVALAWQGKVVEVTDGDTLVVQKGNTEVDVRLYGVDTPESDQHFGTKATRFAARLAGNERVEIDQKDRDQYGRVVGLVYIEGDEECLNEELLRGWLRLGVREVLPHQRL